MSITSVEADVMFHDFMAVRANNGNMVPRAKAGESAKQVASRLLTVRARLSDDETVSASGCVGLSYIRAIDSYSFRPDDLHEEELCLTWRSEDIDPMGFDVIGPRLHQLETAAPGLGETLYAILLDAARTLGGNSIVTPTLLLELYDSYEWEESLSMGLSKGSPIEQIDEKVLDFLVNERGYEDDPDDLSYRLPSALLADLCTEVFTLDFIRNPQRKVQLTADLLYQAGLSREAADKLYRLTKSELPRSVLAMRKARERAEITWAYDAFPRVLAFQDELPDLFNQFLDDSVQNKMSGSEDYPVVMVEAKAPKLKHVRKGASTKQVPITGKPSDPIDVMGSYLNLLDRTDQLIAVLAV